MSRCINLDEVRDVGCCDDSPTTHATKHFQQSRHPIIQTFASAEHWGWCYIDELMLEPASLQKVLR
jgi:Zn-finger in ubiquitin-hydrolases and other protein